MGQAKTPPPAPKKEEAGSDTRKPGSAHDMDAELDEELDQTFPASDPLPTSHRVD